MYLDDLAMLGHGRMKSSVVPGIFIEPIGEIMNVIFVNRPSFGCPQPEELP